MSLNNTKLPFHFLKPGELFIGESPTLVTTLLGSCVSVTMYSHRFKVGAICHGLLPSCKGKRRCDCTDSFRYVDCSIRRMMEGFHQMGIGRGEIEVKVFGGSDMFSADEKQGISIAVGAQNVEMALTVIEREGLRLLVSDVGGYRGRKIYFYTHTGEVLMKRLNERESMEFA